MLNKNPYPKNNYPPLPKKSGKTTGSSSYSSSASSYSSPGSYSGGKEKEALRELQLICALFPKGSKIREAAEKKIKDKDIH